MEIMTAKKPRKYTINAVILIFIARTRRKHLNSENIKPLRQRHILGQ